MATRFVVYHPKKKNLQVEARESAQGKLNASYRGDDQFSTRRVKLISDPGVENS